MKVVIERRCKMCDTVYKIECESEDLAAYLSGAKLIQDAFPYLSADDRELLQSGICGACYDAMWDDDNDD